MSDENGREGGVGYSAGDEVKVIRGPWSGFVCRLESRDADNGWVVSFPGLVTKSGFVFDSELSPPAEPADPNMDWVCSENRRLTHERDRLRVELAETKKAMGILADERDRLLFELRLAYDHLCSRDSDGDAVHTMLGKRFGGE